MLLCFSSQLDRHHLVALLAMNVGSLLGSKDICDGLHKCLWLICVENGRRDRCVGVYVIVSTKLNVVILLWNGSVLSYISTSVRYIPAQKGSLLQLMWIWRGLVCSQDGRQIHHRRPEQRLGVLLGNP